MDGLENGCDVGVDEVGQEVGRFDSPGFVGLDVSGLSVGRSEGCIEGIEVGCVEGCTKG